MDIKQLSGPILVVEDFPNILELLEVALKFMGYPVVTATNGMEALEKIDRQLPSLVVSDILMPKLDGYALGHRLRMNPRTRHIPMIFLSATYVTPEDQAFALSLGGARFIEKPVDTGQFLDMVEEVLKSPPTQTSSLSTREFIHGYRERLESKLHYKNVQITRTERLLETLPEDQKPAYQALLAEARAQRDEIQNELDEVYRSLQRLNQTGQ